MTGIITKKFRLFAAQQFKEIFTEAQGDNVYLFIGRPTPWTDDNNPPAPIDSVGAIQYSVWNNMISMKKASAADVTFAGARNNWTTGTVYTQYTSTTNFHTGAFFVMTDEYNVYKCMYNNKGGTSTVKPTGRLTTVFTTSDGYKWKFMGEIAAADALKYITTSFLPVRTIVSDDGSFQWGVQQAAVNGSIETAGVIAGGANYKTLTGTVVTATSTTVTLPVGANNTNDTYNDSAIYISNGTGVGQLKRIVNYVGGSRIATVNSAFSVTPDTTSTFVLSPRITTAGDGTGFLAYSKVAAGSIDSVEVINRGQNYSFANLTVSANDTTGGSGGSVVAYMSPYGGHGKNPVNELDAHNVMINVKLTGSEGGTFSTNNDFRVVGLIIDPMVANGSPATATTYLVAPTLTKSSGTGTLVADEVLTGAISGATAVFVEYINSTTLMITNVVGVFTAETVTGATSGATAVISAYHKTPMKRYSGDVIYIENRAPIVRSIAQEEDLKAVILL